MTSSLCSTPAAGLPSLKKRLVHQTRLLGKQGARLRGDKQLPAAKRKVPAAIAIGLRARLRRAAARRRRCRARATRRQQLLRPKARHRQQVGQARQRGAVLRRRRRRQRGRLGPGRLAGLRWREWQRQVQVQRLVWPRALREEPA